jgi:hypothetical protein
MRGVMLSPASAIGGARDPVIETARGACELTPVDIVSIVLEYEALLVQVELVKLAWSGHMPPNTYTDVSVVSVVLFVGENVNPADR